MLVCDTKTVSWKPDFSELVWAFLQRYAPYCWMCITYASQTWKFSDILISRKRWFSRTNCNYLIDPTDCIKLCPILVGPFRVSKGTVVSDSRFSALTHFGSQQRALVRANKIVTREKIDVSLSSTLSSPAKIQTISGASVGQMHCTLFRKNQKCR